MIMRSLPGSEVPDRAHQVVTRFSQKHAKEWEMSDRLEKEAKNEH